MGIASVSLVRRISRRTWFFQGEPMRKLMTLLVLVGFVTTIIGCEAKVDDDGAKVKIDKD
jgi:hypothetical protein